jgi:hypothetical protein
MILFDLSVSFNLLSLELIGLVIASPSAGRGSLQSFLF